MRVVILHRMNALLMDYAKWLDATTNQVTILTSETESQILKGNLPSNVTILVIENYEQSGIVERTVVNLHRDSKIDCLMTLSEFDVLRVARLRDFLKIPGMSESAAMYFRDKVLMKEHAARQGIACPQFASVTQPLDLISFFNSHPLPLVLKNRFGGGSIDVSVLRDFADVDAVLKNRVVTAVESVPQLMVETFVGGKMYHIDGLIEEGKLKFAWPSLYTNSVLSFQSGNCLGSTMLEPKNSMFGPLVSLVQKFCENVDGDYSYVFHAEVFESHEVLTICEIACRPAGPRIPEQWEAAFNVSLREIAAKAAIGVRSEISQSNLIAKGNKLASWVIVPNKEGMLSSLPEECPLPYCVKYIKRFKKGDRTSGATNSTSDVVSIILVAPTESELTHATQEAIEWANANILTEEII